MSHSLSTQLVSDLDALFSSIVRDNEKKGVFMTRLQICELISKSPAPRLYITPEQARRLMYNYERYKAKKYSVSGKHEEFYRRYVLLPANQRTYSNISRIIEQPAPSFYLSASYINRILYNIYDRRK